MAQRYTEPPTWRPLSAEEIAPPPEHSTLAARLFWTWIGGAAALNFAASILLILLYQLSWIVLLYIYAAIVGATAALAALVYVSRREAPASARVVSLHRALEARQAAAAMACQCVLPREQSLVHSDLPIPASPQKARCLGASRKRWP